MTQIVKVILCFHGEGRRFIYPEHEELRWSRVDLIEAWNIDARLI